MKNDAAPAATLANGGGHDSRARRPAGDVTETDDPNGRALGRPAAGLAA